MRLGVGALVIPGIGPVLAAGSIMKQAGAVEAKTQRKTWQVSGWAGFDETTLPDESYPGFKTDRT